ncbi:MAG: hypothetical protein ACK6AD_07830 [Cyanobacteriota bacterium]
MLSLLALIPVTGCSKLLPPCVQAQPADSPIASAAATGTPAKEILIGIDGSGSMLGYARSADPSVWLRLLQSVNLSAKLRGLQVRAFRVGGGTATTLPGSIATPASNPCFFKGCAPFQPVASSLQSLWRIPTPTQTLPLRLLISDLEVNQSDISSLIGGLKADLAKGASAGILALKLPFAGPVFNSQGQPFAKGPLNRPVYLLATGPADQVKGLLEEIRKNMAQKGIKSQELSILNPTAGARTLTAKDAQAIPPEQGAVGLPLLLSHGRFDPTSNGDYRFIKLMPGASGFSVMTLRPWSGGTTRPDLGLVSLERIPLSPEESSAAAEIKVRSMSVAGSHLRLDLDVPASAPSGALRATISVVPERWWIDWDRDNPKAAKAGESTEGLLLFLTTLESQIRQARGAAPAATLCMAFQTNS